MPAMPDWFIWSSTTELAHAILVAREAAGWSQAELGRRAGLNRKFIYRLENGRGSVGVDKALRVLAALGLMPLIVSAEAAAVLR